MDHTAFPLSEPALQAVAPLPLWTQRAGQKTLSELSFSAGAVLSHLHGLLQAEAVPQALLRDRLSLMASANLMAVIGRPEREADLRDVLHLSLPGDALGPAGEVAAQHRRVMAKPISTFEGARILPDLDIDAILRPGAGAPIACACDVIGTVSDAYPRQDEVALLLADIALAKALGWRHALPLLSLGLRRQDLRRDIKLGSDERLLTCHAGVLRAGAQITGVAADLARRVARLDAVAPKLRAKQAGAAVALWRREDALCPARLADPQRGVGLSARSARRLCDRLVELGALRELTGRDSFRIYGL